MGRRHKRTDRTREQDIRRACTGCGTRVLARFLDARGRCESCAVQLALPIKITT